MIINILIFIIILIFINSIIKIKEFNIIQFIYIMLILYYFYKIFCNYEFFDNIIFNGKKYINTINDVENNIINDENNDEFNNKVNNEINNESNKDINLSLLKNEFNKDKIKLIFNLSNRPIENEKKTYNDIKYMVLNIINLMKLKNFNLYLRNIININQDKVDNQAKLSFNMIIDNNKDINLNIYVELLFEKLFDNQDVFNNNIESNFKTYLNKLEFIKIN